MFCTNCGKQIVDTARFCNYCGAEVVNFAKNAENLTQNLPSNPIAPPTDSVPNTGKPENVENSVDLLKTTEQVPTSIPQMNETSKSGFAAPQMGEIPFSQPKPSAVSSQPNTSFTENLGQPAPDVPPTEPPVGGAAPQFAQVAPAAPAPQLAAAAPEAAKKHTAEHKYTLGHLIMCLASTAIMAIVAGVFAGLYFSVV